MTFVCCNFTTVINYVMAVVVVEAIRVVEVENVYYMMV